MNRQQPPKEVYGSMQCPCCEGKGEIYVEAEREHPKTIAVRALRSKGMTFRDITKTLGLSSTSVAYYHFKKDNQKPV